MFPARRASQCSRDQPGTQQVAYYLHDLLWRIEIHDEHRKIQGLPRPQGPPRETAVKREKFVKNKSEKYFKGKAVNFTVQRLIFFQYPVDLQTFLELYLKRSKYLKMGHSDLLAPFVKAIGHFRVIFEQPLFQSEAKCETFHMKMSFHSLAKVTHFHIEGFSLDLDPL